MLPKAVPAQVDQGHLEDPGLDTASDDGDSERPVEEPGKHGDDVYPHCVDLWGKARTGRNGPGPDRRERLPLLQGTTTAPLANRLGRAAT